MTTIVARQAPTFGTTAQLNASPLLLYPGERWIAIDAADAAHTYKTGALAGDKTFSQLPWDPAPGTGGGTATLPQATGPVLFGRDATDNGDLGVLTVDQIQAMLDYAKVSSTDPDETTLSSISQDFADLQAIGVTDFSQSVHGIWPATVWQWNVLTGRTVVRAPRDQTTGLPLASANQLPGGNAPSGCIEFAWIPPDATTVADRGFWLRDDSRGWQKLYPMDSYTPTKTKYFVGPASAADSWTLPASGTQELFNAQRNRVGVTLMEDDGVTKRYTQARVGTNRITTAGPAGASGQLYYYTGSALTAITSATIPLDATGNTKPGAWANIPQAVYDRELTAGVSYTELAFVGAGGNGTTALNFVGFYVEFR